MVVVNEGEVVDARVRYQGSQWGRVYGLQLPAAQFQGKGPTDGMPDDFCNDFFVKKFVETNVFHCNLY